MVALYNPYSNSKLPIQITIPKESKAQTFLMFDNSSIATSSSLTDPTYSLPISITTGSNKVTAVQLELQYDPKILTDVSVAPGAFFKNPVILLNQIDSKTGRISYAFGISPAEQGVVGQDIVAVLNFKTLTAPEPTVILFLPKTLVTAEGTNESVLKETNVGQFTIGKK